AVLTPDEKKETLNWIINEYFGADAIDQRYRIKALESELNDEFRPFGMVDVYGFKKSSQFNQTGLSTYLKKHFRGLYHSHENLEFTPSAIDLNHHKIKIF